MLLRSVLVLALVASATGAHAQSTSGSSASVEDIDSSGWTALMRAAEYGELDQIKTLLARGANIEASNPEVYDGATPVVIALHFDEYDAAVLLLARGAKLEGKNASTALVLAARSGFDDLVDRFIKAKISPKGTIALEVAAAFGHVSTIKKLVKAGAVVRERDTRDHGFTPFIVACQKNQLAAAKTLLALGANVNDVDDDGTPALHWAVFGERPDEIHIYRTPGGPHDTLFRPHEDAPLVKLLLAKGAKREARDAEGNTALHQAVLMDSAAAAKVLLAAGAKRNVKNAEGKTPYDLAKDRKSSIEPLLRRR
jgi:ankyrin repeat protein